MSSTQFVTCQQCETSAGFEACDKHELRVALDAAGWAPYGTGVTPFAEEFGQRGEFSCPRCTNELVEARLNRLASDVVGELAISDPWRVVRTAESPTDHMRVLRSDSSVQVEFEQHRTDRETREYLRDKLIRALRLK